MPMSETKEAKFLKEDMDLFNQYSNDPSKFNTKRINVMWSIQIGKYPACIVTNVVSSVILSMVQNQKKVALYAKDKLPVFYDPKIFAFSQQPMCMNGYPAVKMLYFSGKKNTIVGGLSEDHNRLVAIKSTKYLRRIFGVDIRLEDCSTKNIVANVNMPFNIKLDSIQGKILGRANFKQNEIDCCRVKSKYGGSMRILIFNTGSMLLIGSKTEDQLLQLYVEACEIAYDHKTMDDSKTSQKNSKKRSISADVLERANIDITNAIMCKRQKIMNSKRPEKVKQMDLEKFDSEHGINDIKMAMIDYPDKPPEGNFVLPSSSVYMIEAS
jgi:TATA-box binding protein (TBP) (component of TFIID and TFIIIB)